MTAITLYELSIVEKSRRDTTGPSCFAASAPPAASVARCLYAKYTSRPMPVAAPSTATPIIAFFCPFFF